MAPEPVQMGNAMKRDQTLLMRALFWLFLVMAAVLLAAVLLSGCERSDSRLLLGGGPRGGSFQGVAEEVAAIVNELPLEKKISVRPSGGSEANLFKVSQGRFDLALAYAGDAFLAKKGTLRQDRKPLENVEVLARLYGGAAQLVVADWSVIGTPYDLKGKRVAIGNPGSGTALSAERYFSSLGIWQEIIPIHVGFSMAMKELARRDVEAVWFLSGYPNQLLTTASQRRAIRLIDLLSFAQEHGFFINHPYYTETVIPPGTYTGQEQPVSTFEDAVLLVAGSHLSDEFVYRALEIVFSEEGLQRMRGRYPETLDMQVPKGLSGVVGDLHTGAERFWMERR